MPLVVLGVKAGQEEEDDGDEGEKLLGGGKLLAVVYLLPLRFVARTALVGGFPWRAFGNVQHDEHDHVVDYVGEGPCSSHAEEGHAEDEEVYHEDDYDIRQPDALAVEVGMRWVGVAMSYSHVHLGCSGCQQNVRPRNEATKVNLTSEKSDEEITSR